MKILLLADQWTIPQAVRDLEVWRSQINPQRIQFKTASMRPPVDTDLSIDQIISSDGRLATLRALRDVIQQYDIELVHILEPRALINGILAAKLTGIPALYSHYQPYQFLSPPWRDILSPYLWQSIARWGLTQILVANIVIERELRLTLGIPHDRLIVLPVGYPAAKTSSWDTATARQQWGLPQDVPLIGIVAPEYPAMSYLTLFEVYPRLMERSPTVQYVVIGSGLNIDTWQQAIQRLATVPPIHWLPIPHDMIALLAAMDVIAAYPAEEVDVPALVQAALAGRPAVVTRFNATQAIVDDAATGMLVTLNDLGDLAVQLRRLLQQHTFAQRLGEQAQERALARFSQTAELEMLTVLYEQTIYATR